MSLIKSQLIRFGGSRRHVWIQFHVECVTSSGIVFHHVTFQLLVEIRLIGRGNTWFLWFLVVSVTGTATCRAIAVGAAISSLVTTRWLVSRSSTSQTTSIGICSWTDLVHFHSTVIASMMAAARSRFSDRSWRRGNVATSGPRTRRNSLCCQWTKSKREIVGIQWIKLKVNCCCDGLNYFNWPRRHMQQKIKYLNKNNPTY